MGDGFSGAGFGDGGFTGTASPLKLGEKALSRAAQAALLRQRRRDVVLAVVVSGMAAVLWLMPWAAIGGALVEMAFPTA